MVGVPLGLAFAWRHRRHQAALPLAAAAILTAAFAAAHCFGLPLIGRYVRTPAVLLALFYGLAVAGWQLLPPGRSRNSWAAAGAVAGALSLAFLPRHAAMFDGLDRRIARSSASYAELQTWPRAPRFARPRRGAGRSPPPTTARCRSCATGSTARPGSVVIASAANPTPGHPSSSPAARRWPAARQRRPSPRRTTRYGLSAGVWTEKGSKILWMADRLRAGVVWANTYNRFDPSSPFGGYRESGFGREGGLHGLAPYLELVGG